MISKLAGKVLEYDGAIAIVDCGGVGYGVLLTQDDQAKNPAGTGLSIYISEHIRENGHDLYGFITKSSRDLFERLMQVNGIGPKAGLAILNLGSESQIRGAIASGDVKFITSASGIGKKVAERIIVDLKNKVGLEPTTDATSFLDESPIAGDEAVQALMSLGYNSVDAANALRNVPKDISTEDRIKQALKAR